MKIPPYIGEPERIQKLLQEFTLDQSGQKDTFAHFRGSISGNSGSDAYSGGVRQWLFSQRERLRSEWNFHIFDQHLPSTEAYFIELARSTFCISPAGWVSWSPRLFQAVAAQCIPVIIGPRSDLPFAALPWLDYDKFTLRFDGPLDELPNFLSSVPKESIKAMQRYLAAVWHRFTYRLISEESSSITPDAFDMVMGVLRQRLRKTTVEGFSLKDELVLDLAEGCLTIPGRGGVLEVSASLSRSSTFATALKHVRATGREDDFEVVV